MSWTVFRNVMIYSEKERRHVPVRVDMEFDLEAIARELGRKALRNKSGKSKLAIGIKAEARIQKNARP
ncbi:hypothetical protein RFN29_15045 [Mesorhizobium sp. VK22B]|uniref:Uncharacterized protein n=1 Tax=Mesorhizobium captivum TaxID=3072319 RepID=A0ABU4Z2S0_9HYPH|nr:hypothetical protein [Mesorhizobium sp. VK22B]MDX8492893.1 hypothetical protein [Mesorhizobium sp. VK22B]